jgi:nucleotide-binding universal stress UspA family protein
LTLSTSAAPSLQRILVAIDGSENSRRAAGAAIDLAKKNGANLFILSVIPTPVYTETTVQGVAAMGADVKTYVDKAKSEAEALIQGQVAKAEKEGIKVRGEIVENVSSVVESIVDYAEEWKVDLIVVGTRGLTGFKKLLLGSVSAALVSHAPCSILVIR